MNARGRRSNHHTMILRSRLYSHDAVILSTSRTANLGRACQARGAAAGDRNAPFRKQASLAKRGIHPSRGMPLRGMRPLRLAEAWRAGRVAAGVLEAAAPATPAPPPPRPQAAAAFEAPPEDFLNLDTGGFEDNGGILEPPDECPQDEHPGEEDYEDEDIFQHGGDLGLAAYHDGNAQEASLGTTGPEEAYEDEDI